jgi:hypothetical protein
MRSVRARIALAALSASLMARPASAQTVVPVLDCVIYNQSNNTLLAFFGYASSFATPIQIEIGVNNFFSPGVLFRNQPTEFLPGLHQRDSGDARNSTTGTTSEMLPSPPVICVMKAIDSGVSAA